jgi:hypothetical protein
MGTGTKVRTGLGFAAVILAAIALMPLLVETGRLPAGATAEARSLPHQGLEVAALR